MSDKGFFASICSFFGSLFSSDSDQSRPSSANTSSNNSSLTGVESYIRNQAQTASSSTLTSVEAYIQANSKPVTSVESYIRNQAAAGPITTVEQYIRNNS